MLKKVIQKIKELLDNVLQCIFWGGLGLIACRVAWFMFCRFDRTVTSHNLSTEGGHLDFGKALPYLIPLGVDIMLSIALLFLGVCLFATAFSCLTTFDKSDKKEEKE